MNTQTKIKNTLTFSIFTLPIYAPISETMNSAKEMGYEIDDDDLASEMIAELPACFQDEVLPSVDPDEFETAYKWFLS